VHVDAGDRHQPADIGRLERLPGEHRLEGLDLALEEIDLAQAALAVSSSSSGSSRAPSQRRPALLNRWRTGGRPQRLRASTPCTSFLARVRARTSRARRDVRRRSARVRSSGAHTSSR
jgi:hypothetical protein